jgi:hypothetical protein
MDIIDMIQEIGGLKGLAKMMGGILLGWGCLWILLAICG